MSNSMSHFFEKDTSPDRRPKSDQSAEIARQVEDFLNRGGTIQRFQTGAHGVDGVEQHYVREGSRRKLDEGNTLAACGYCMRMSRTARRRRGFARPICDGCYGRRRTGQGGAARRPT